MYFIGIFSIDVVLDGLCARLLEILWINLDQIRDSGLLPHQTLSDFETEVLRHTSINIVVSFFRLYNQVGESWPSHWPLDLNKDFTSYFKARFLPLPSLSIVSFQGLE